MTLNTIGYFGVFNTGGDTAMPEIPWLKRFDEERERTDEEPETMEKVDYEVMLEELEFR